VTGRRNEPRRRASHVELRPAGRWHLALVRVKHEPEPDDKHVVDSRRAPHAPRRDPAPAAASR
jgi:hypothetical protein